MLGFDVESANEYVDGVEFSDLGLSCAALVESGGDEPLYYAAIDEIGFYEDQMSSRTARELADAIIAFTEQNDYIVTWNGTSFDFPLLSAVCDDPTYESRLKWAALNHIDLGLNMAIEKGFMIGLDKAAHGLGLEGKTEGMTGSLAPILWKGVNRLLTDEEVNAIANLDVEPHTDQARDLCVTYVANDAKVTIDVHDTLRQRGSLYWITRRGTLSKYPWRPQVVSGMFPLVKHWLDKEQYDTGWEDNPFHKEDLMRWVL